MESKLKRFAGVVRSNPGIMICPICRNTLNLSGGRGLRCSENHSYDISSKGYLNLLGGRKDKLYGIELFRARRKIFESGFFDKLIDETAAVISGSSISGRDLRIVDAGCGEGSFLKFLTDKLSEESTTFSVMAGFEISTEGIRCASLYPGYLWVVSDLSRLPLASGSADIILNILSPANYASFTRVIREGGLFIKVIPGKNHLRELRGFFKLKEYSNESVLRHLKDNYPELKLRTVSEERNLQKGILENLIRMTPLTGKVKIDSSVLLRAEEKIGEVTSEFTIAYGPLWK